MTTAAQIAAYEQEQLKIIDEEEARKARFESMPGLVQDFANWLGSEDDEGPMGEAPNQQDIERQAKRKAIAEQLRARDVQDETAGIVNDWSAHPENDGGRNRADLLPLMEGDGFMGLDMAVPGAMADPYNALVRTMGNARNAFQGVGPEVGSDESRQMGADGALAILGGALPAGASRASMGGVRSLPMVKNHKAGYDTRFYNSKTDEYRALRESLHGGREAPDIVARNANISKAENYATGQREALAKALQQGQKMAGRALDYEGNVAQRRGDLAKALERRQSLPPAIERTSDDQINRLIMKSAVDGSSNNALTREAQKRGLGQEGSKAYPAGGGVPMQGNGLAESARGRLAQSLTQSRLGPMADDTLGKRNPVGNWISSNLEKSVAGTKVADDRAAIARALNGYTKAPQHELVGKTVEYTSQSAGMHGIPLKVTSVSDDGAYVMVKGMINGQPVKTGLPIDQVKPIN